MIKLFCLTYRQDPNRRYRSISEWDWEQWQRRGTSNSPELQDFIRTFRLFSVISRTLVEYTYCLPSHLELQNPSTASLKRGKHPPKTCAPDMTLNSLIVRFQWYWSFGECGAPLHCHRSLIHLVAPDRSLSIGQIELNCVLMLYWIACNRAVFDIETVIRKIEYFEIKLFCTVCKQNLYSYLTEFAELELFDETELLEIEMFFLN